MEKENKKVKKGTQNKVQKKASTKKMKYRTAEQDEMINFVIVILIVLACVAAIYFLTRIFVTKDLFKEEQPTVDEVIPGVIDYDVAIMGQLLNRPEKEYYVVIYNQAEGDYVAEMSLLMNTYKAEKDAKKMYSVDLSNKLNESHYDPENVETDIKKLEKMEVKDIKVGDITLIKVKKGKIVKYIVDYAKMEKELGIEDKK